jgi:hypothetical protein
MNNIKNLLKYVKSDPKIIVGYKIKLSQFLIGLIVILGVINLYIFYTYFNPGFNFEIKSIERVKKHESLIIKKTKKILENKAKWEKYTFISSIIYSILFILIVFLNKSSFVSDLLNYLFIILLIQQY